MLEADFRRHSGWVTVLLVALLTFAIVSLPPVGVRAIALGLMIALAGLLAWVFDLFHDRRHGRDAQPR